MDSVRHIDGAYASFAKRVYCADQSFGDHGNHERPFPDVHCFADHDLYVPDCDRFSAEQKAEGTDPADSDYGQEAAGAGQGTGERQPMSQYTGLNHTYVICAYRESAYLEECILSLLSQAVPSHIIMATSTPNEFIRSLSDRYGIELYVNAGESGIAGDWNFALSCVKTEIATIAHQDDIYEPWYTQRILEGINRSRKPLILFTDYGELREGEKEDSNVLLNIKRFMLFPLRMRCLQRSRFVRRRILSFGSPISCPTVSYFLPNLTLPVFTAGYKSDLDWQAWERISRSRGEFVFCPGICMYHRIHAESTTSEILRDNERMREDYEMFSKFWPGFFARILEHFYKCGEKSNEVGK